MVNQDHKGLLRKTSEIVDKLRDVLDKKNSFLVLCHFDADGLSAGGIIGKALFRQDAPLHIKVIKQIDADVLSEASAIEHDLTIFTEIGSGYIKEIDNTLRNDDVVIIDHHPPEKDTTSITHHINPAMFGYDGSREISGAGMAYLIAKKLSNENKDLSVLAVVGALGDMQDKNEQRRLKGLNEEIVEEAAGGQFLEVKTDLIFFGRETRPIHKALATTTSPFLPGLSGREDRCYSLITSLNIPVKDGDNWRTITNLSEEEKKRLITAIVEYLSDEGFNVESVKGLIGGTYTLLREAKGTFLRDGREYASTLNACGRMNRGGLGISLCLGDRNRALKEVEEVMTEYKRNLSQTIEWITQNREKIQRMEILDVVRGEETVEESFTGAISSMLNSTGGFDPNKVIIVVSKQRVAS